MNESPAQTGVETIDSDEIRILELVELLSEHFRTLVWGPLIVGLAVLAGSFLIAPKFTAMTKFLPPQQQQNVSAALMQNLGALSGLAGAAGLKSPADQYVALIQSRSVQDRLIQRFELQKKYDVEYKEDVVKRLVDKTKVSTGKDGLITLEFEEKDPAEAAKIANAYVEELTVLLGRLALTEAQQRRLFFEKQLQKAKEKLIESEESLRSSGIDAGALKSNPQAAMANVAQLEARVAAQEVKIISMRGIYSDSAPDVKLAITELHALKSQLAKLGKSSAQTEGDGSYVTLFRNFKYHETMYDLMARQYEIAKIDEARDGAVIQVVDVAQPPEHKSGPKRGGLAVMATLVSAFILLIWIVCRRMWQKQMADPATAMQVQNILGNLHWKSKKINQSHTSM